MMKRIFALLFALGMAFGLTMQAHAVPTQINDRNLLPHNDFVDWSVLGPPGTCLPIGFTVVSNGGLTLTVNNTIEPDTPFCVFQQVPPIPEWFWWNGNFAPGDAVLAPNGRPGATLIQFASPVLGAGVQIQGGLLGTSFTAILVVTDITHAVHTYSETGYSSSSADNSAIFLGVLDDTADIVSIEYSVVGDWEYANGPGINRLDIVSPVPVPPSEQLDMILGFFDESVSNETLTGVGPGKSAKNRLNALRNMLEAAREHIGEGSIAEACQQLLDAYKKTDGNPKPPDFVTGEAASELANKIQALRANLGCQ